MKKNRVWMEIVILGTAIACAIALLFATLGAAAGVAEGEVSSPQTGDPATTQQPMPSTADQARTESMVTCSRCGAKHSASLAQSATTCIRTCVHGGADFVLVGANVTYMLDGDLNVLKKMAGQRARP